MDGFQIAEYFPLRLTEPMRHEIDRGSYMTCPCIAATDDRASASMPDVSSSIHISTQLIGQFSVLDKQVNPARHRTLAPKEKSR
jgi:hypothetical protein